MRILAIETSSQRGSISLTDGVTSIATEEHREPSAHAERMLPLVARALSGAGWARSTIDRIAVGVGPGSFVGLRVGIALAEGLSLGLGRPVVGVSSLSAMLWALARVHAGPAAALLDARRGEVFCAARASDGSCLLEPCATPLSEIASLLQSFGSDLGIAGEVVSSLGLSQTWHRGPELDLPHAYSIAMLAHSAAVDGKGVVPQYVRGPGATRPNLPPSPLTPR